jgi:hypothetical protein
MGNRTWIKLYCEPWIQGTLREENPDVRGIWADLLALAGSGQYGDTGEIKPTNGVGYTDEQISQILCIKKPLWRKAKRRLLETERIEISSKGAISITNWSKYQSEYNRQKQYRTEKEQTFTPEPKVPLNNPSKENEKEIEKESEKLQREVTTESYNEVDVPPPEIYSVESDISTIPPMSLSLKAPKGKAKANSLTNGHTVPPGEDRATLESDLSAPGGPSRGSSSTALCTTNRQQIIEYMKANGPARIKAIAQGTGINPNLTSVTLHNGKGKVFYHDSEKRIWGVTDNYDE